MRPFSQASFHLVDLLDELLDHAQDRVADEFCLLLELVKIDPVYLAALHNLIGGVTRNDTELGLCAGQRRFKVQVVLCPSLV